MSRQRIRFGGPNRTTSSRKPRHTRSSDRHPHASSEATDSVTVRIETLSIEGRGVARVDGKTLFVSGALPGELVEARITEHHKRYDEGHCLSVSEAAAERLEPFCPHYQQCGGCELQHLEPAAQIRYKEALVLDQLKRFAQLEPDRLDSPLSGPSQHYRRAARIGINQRADGQLLMGFRRRASHKLLDIDSCPVLEPRINTLLAHLRATLETQGTVKSLTHADISCGEASCVLTLRATRRPQPALRQALLDTCDALAVELWFEYNDGERERASAPAAELSYSVDQPALQLKFAPGDFLQVNAEINRQMIARSLDWLQPQATDHVLDLFCGLGNFTLPLARRAGRVVGVEGSADMVARAEQNARHNGIENVQFFKSDLSADIRNSPWYQASRQQGFDLILLDPPRTGATEAVSQLVHYGARAILYVSCNPSALVRDSATLTAAGYRLNRFCVMDMFPHTAHVESLALFIR